MGPVICENLKIPTTASALKYALLKCCERNSDRGGWHLVCNHTRGEASISRDWPGPIPTNLFLSISDGLQRGKIRREFRWTGYLDTSQNKQSVFRFTLVKKIEQGFFCRSNCSKRALANPRVLESLYFIGFFLCVCIALILA